jgi:hypothetical protein
LSKIKIIDVLPKEKDGSLSFVVFLRFIHWIENSDIETKLGAIFSLITAGEELRKQDLIKTLKQNFLLQLYPDSSNVKI